MTSRLWHFLNQSQHHPLHLSSQWEPPSAANRNVPPHSSMTETKIACLLKAHPTFCVTEYQNETSRLLPARFWYYWLVEYCRYYYLFFVYNIFTWCCWSNCSFIISSYLVSDHHVQCFLCHIWFDDCSHTEDREQGHMLMLISLGHHLGHQIPWCPGHSRRSSLCLALLELSAPLVCYSLCNPFLPETD